jgi:hypothetical protein
MKVSAKRTLRMKRVIKRARTLRKQKGGIIPDTFQTLIMSPNIDYNDKKIIEFLWKKLEEFEHQQTIPEKRIIYIAIFKILENIRTSFMDSNYKEIQGSPYILEALGYLFDELNSEFSERLQNPVKSCIPLPGKWGQPTVCPEKDTEKLQTCIMETHRVFKEAKRQRRKLYDDSKKMEAARIFIDKALEFFATVQSSTSCRAFSRLDNFAKNKGMYMKGHIALFRILASFYLGDNITVNNASSTSTFSNSESAGDE